ncbi:MAG TPA: PhoD-like phosphatase N-terminal domain-containing protein [Polyangiales bacterium]
MRLRLHPSRELADSAPSFARDGQFAPLQDPFRELLEVASAEPGSLVLRTKLSGCAGFSVVPVHWEVSREPSFFRPERYGLLLALEREGFSVRVSLEGLERGRSYWARLWAGGTWSRAVRARTGPRANGSSTLALELARRLQTRAS